MSSSLRLAPDESARRLVRRLRKPRAVGCPVLDAIYGESESGDVVEIYGESRSGKTELLVNFVLKWTMPAPAGNGRCAVYFDNDFKLPGERLHAILGAKVADERQRLETLKRITVARCATTLEFLAALEVVINQQGDRGLLVVIDSLGAFVWREDKLAEAGLAPPSFTPACCRNIGRLVRDHQAIVIAAKPALFKSRGASESTHEEYMPREWSKLVRRRVEVTPNFDFRLFEQGKPKSLSKFTVSDAGVDFLP